MAILLYFPSHTCILKQAFTKDYIGAFNAISLGAGEDTSTLSHPTSEIFNQPKKLGKAQAKTGKGLLRNLAEEKSYEKVEDFLSSLFAL